MIRSEGSTEGSLRVVGPLKEAVLKDILDTVGAGSVALDLSGVKRADPAAVHLLALEPPDRFRLVRCPSWLALWMEQERRRARSWSGT